MTADSNSSPLYDFGQLAAEVVLTGSEKPFAILNPREARHAATKTASDGTPLHPDMTFTGGILAGVPCLVSEAQTAGTIDLIDAGGLIYTDDGIKLKPSESGMIDQVDNPNPDSPATITSLFQENAIALGAFRYLGWRLARTASVARITSVDWS